MIARKKLAVVERKIARAALKLAGQGAWEDVTPEQIARTAKIAAVKMLELFPNTVAILPVIVRLIDEDMAEAAENPDESASARDRLFEIMMARFDVLQTWRDGVISIADAGKKSPKMLCAILSAQMNSMRETLELAGLDEDGTRGLTKAAGLLAVYDLTFLRWMRDDTPDMSATMSALDRNLRYADGMAKALFPD